MLIRFTQVDITLIFLFRERFLVKVASCLSKFWRNYYWELEFCMRNFVTCSKKTECSILFFLNVCTVYRIKHLKSLNRWWINDILDFVCSYHILLIISQWILSSFLYHTKFMIPVKSFPSILFIILIEHWDFTDTS
jgi:hypothetical protein